MPFVAGGMEYGALCVINEALSGTTYEEVVAHDILPTAWQIKGHLIICGVGKIRVADRAVFVIRPFSVCKKTKTLLRQRLKTSETLL